MKILLRSSPLSPKEQRGLLYTWSKAGTRRLNSRRLHANATILPTGEIFVSGGKSGGSLDETRVLQGEIYNPETKRLTEKGNDKALKVMRVHQERTVTGCLLKKRTISCEASGPFGSVNEP